MTTEHLSRAVESAPQGAERPPLSSPRVVAVSLVWFFAWPVVLFACFPLVTPGDALEALLFGGGSLIWFLSCYGSCGMLLAIVNARWRSPLLYHRTGTVMAGWFFGWFPLLIVCGHLASLIEHPYWIDLSFIIPGTILWMAS